MTLHHDLHMARLRIARLEEALELAYFEGHIDGWIGGATASENWMKSGTRRLLTPPASSPRPAPVPCEASEARPAQEA